MQDSTSRYSRLPNRILQGDDGTKVVYKARRFLPQGQRLAVRAHVAVDPGERLDLLTARTLGPPELFWRVADANDAMDPFDLVAVPGRFLALPAPKPDETLPSMER